MSRQDQYCEVCGARLADQRRDRVEVDIGMAAGVSDRGRRPRRNEDALAMRDLGSATGARPTTDARPTTYAGSGAVAIVCDGVSCAARPDEASETAAETAAEALVAALRAAAAPAVATWEAIQAAGAAVAALADDDLDVQGAPACTLVSAVVIGGAVTVGWIGDSRAYWIPRAGAGRLPPTRLTEDDSWLAQVLAAGTMTLAEATADRRAHAITAWLGEDATELDPHIVTITPDAPGLVVICTDGLWNYLDSVDDLAAALPAEAFDAPLTAARKLVEIALHAGGRDNITVAVLPFTPPPGEAS